MLNQLIRQSAFHSGFNEIHPSKAPPVIKNVFSLKSLSLKNELARLLKKKTELANELSTMDEKIASVESRIKMIENEGNP